jgi:hypothetical protein
MNTIRNDKKQHTKEDQLKQTDPLPSEAGAWNKGEGYLTKKNI